MGVPFSVRVTIPNDDIEGVSILVDPNVPDGLLWAPTIRNNHHAVLLNPNHPFYQKIYVPNHPENDVICGLDALFWALCESFWGMMNSESKKTLENIQFNVSKLLRDLVEDLPDPEV